MEKSDERSLTQAKTHSISTAAASLAGRGLRDLQKIQEWELVFPEDRIVGWLEVMDKSIPAQGIVKIPKGVQIGFRLEKNESDLSFFSGLSANVPLNHLDFSGIWHQKRIQVIGIPNIYLNSGCKEIANEALIHLLSLTQLQKINLHGCKQVTDQGLLHLSGLPQLQELDLRGCEQITDVGLAYLSGLKQLQILKVSFCDQITDKGLACLSGLHQLQELSLNGCKHITDRVLAHLSGLSQLQTLMLWGCEQITDEGLVHLSGLTRLQEINLHGCKKITNAGLAQLSHIPNIYGP